MSYCVVIFFSKGPKWMKLFQEWEQFKISLGARREQIERSFDALFRRRQPPDRSESRFGGKPVQFSRNRRLPDLLFAARLTLALS